MFRILLIILIFLCSVCAYSHPAPGFDTKTLCIKEGSIPTDDGGCLPDPTPQPAMESVVETPDSEPEVVSTPLSVFIPKPLLVTEHMMRDGGARRLPVWIELYNPNAVAVSMKGYTFTWASRKFANHPWMYHVVSIGDFSIPGNSAVILVSKATRDTEGLADSEVYNLGIRHGRLLKSGWKITDTENNEVFSVGQAFGKGGPVLKGSWKIRESYQVYKSADPPMQRYYGAPDDKGSPGFFEAIVAAPTVVKHTRIGLWANLKR